MRLGRAATPPGLPSAVAGKRPPAPRATLDLAVSRDGRLAKVTRQVELATVGKPDPSADQNAVSAL